MPRPWRIFSTLLCGLLTLPALAITPQSEDEMLRDFMWQRFIQLPRSERPQIGLALSAGGVRGFAHVGVLEVFDNAGLPIDRLAGTSMGSVVGGFLQPGSPLNDFGKSGSRLLLATSPRILT